jgi:hypothetical protein
MGAAHKVVHTEVGTVILGSVFDVRVAEEDEAMTRREWFVIAKESPSSPA